MSFRVGSFKGLSEMEAIGLAQHSSTLLASVFIIATTTMRTMIPLRVFAIMTNMVFIVSAMIAHNHLQLILHLLLVPLNGYRLVQMLRLLRDVKRSIATDMSIDWLKSFMVARKCVRSQIVFFKDEKAEELIFIMSGRFRLVESGMELPIGTIVGELGMLSPLNARTQTLECIEAGSILSLAYSQVEELYVQNPEFGFYFLRLATARLFQNIRNLEERLADQNGCAVSGARS